MRKTPQNTGKNHPTGRKKRKNTLSRNKKRIKSRHTPIETPGKFTRESILKPLGKERTSPLKRKIGKYSGVPLEKGIAKTVLQPT